MLIKTVIVDDEPLAVEKLKYILAYFKDIKVEASFINPLKALEESAVIAPDLFFLDIEMPELDGMELAEKLMAKIPQAKVIFMTAYSEYAVMAFEMAALDYIVKPATKERIKKALERIEKSHDVSKLPEQNKKGETVINTFSRLCIQKDCREIKVNWRSAKVKELFAYLLTFGKKPIYREKLMDDIWPHLSYESALSSMNSCLYQLRKVLYDVAEDIEISYVNGAYGMNMGAAIVDSDIFKNNISQTAKKSLPEVISTLSIYTGAYLAYEDYAWLAQERAWYSNQYILAGTDCARIYLQKKMSNEAIALARQLLREQSYSEEIWEIIITACKQKGDRGMALQTYKEMEQLFIEELGVKPTIKI